MVSFVCDSIFEYRLYLHVWGLSHGAMAAYSRKSYSCTGSTSTVQYPRYAESRRFAPRGVAALRGDKAVL